MAEDRSSLTRGPSIKNRFLSFWNNAKYTQVFKVKFPPNEPVFVLGIMYHERQFIAEIAPQHAWRPAPGHAIGGPHVMQDEEPPHVVELLKDIKSRLFFSYRQGFPALDGGYTSDVGWGCMVRSGQMLLAEALVTHVLSRSWRLDVSDPSDYQREIVRMFEDKKSDTSPFSLHQLLRYASVPAGNWIGPTTIARAICRAVNKNAGLLGRLRPLRAHFAADCILYKDEVMRTVQATGVPWVPVLIIIPLRLGLKTLNPVYKPALKDLFSHEVCVGIMGGRPRHALHFIGFQGDDLIGLDPHLCQNTVDMSSGSFSLETFHCGAPRKVSFSQLDPSLAVGFYCDTPAALDKVYSLGSPQGPGKTQLFSVADSFASAGQASSEQTSAEAFAEKAPQMIQGMSPQQARYWAAKGISAEKLSVVLPSRPTEQEETSFWAIKHCRGCGGKFCDGDWHECNDHLHPGQRCWDWQLDPMRKHASADLQENGLTMRCVMEAATQDACACIVATRMFESGRHHWAARLDWEGESREQQYSETVTKTLREENKAHLIDPGPMCVGLAWSERADLHRMPGSDGVSIGWCNQYIVCNGQATALDMLEGVTFRRGDLVGLLLEVEATEKQARLWFSYNSQVLGSVKLPASRYFIPVFGLRNNLSQLTALPGLPEPDFSPRAVPAADDRVDSLFSEAAAVAAATLTAAAATAAATAAAAATPRHSLTVTDNSAEQRLGHLLPPAGEHGASCAGKQGQQAAASTHCVVAADEHSNGYHRPAAADENGHACAASDGSAEESTVGAGGAVTHIWENDDSFEDAVDDQLPISEDEEEEILQPLQAPF